MARLGTGERSAWKERIDQSSWVDGTQWVADGAASDADAGVEFLEAEPSAYRLSDSTPEESPATTSSPIPRLVGFGAVAIVLLALAIMSRPGDQDPFEQLPPDKQQEIRQRQAGPATDGTDGTGGTDGTDRTDGAGGGDGAAATSLPQPIPTPETAGAAEGGGVAGDGAESSSGQAAGPRVLGPIPELREELPADLPGRIVTYGRDATVVQVARSMTAPEETEFDGVDPGSDGSMVVSGASLLLVADRMGLVVDEGGTVVSGDTEVDRLLPADDGVVIVQDEGQTSEVEIIGIDGEATTPDQRPWRFGEDVELLGVWRGRMLVHKVGTVWSVGRDGESSAVASGWLLGYDGTHLAMVRCSGINSCRIEVGPPDQPALRSIEVPGRLAGRELGSWTGVVAISADGSRIGLIDRRVSVPLPMWIDMDTGEMRTRSETVNADSPIAWSPDGVWLAYVFGDDLIVWNTDIDRSWRVVLDRQIGQLGWMPEPAES